MGLLHNWETFRFKGKLRYGNAKNNWLVILNGNDNILDSKWLYESYIYCFSILIKQMWSLKNFYYKFIDIFLQIKHTF